jgi:hypothetical protein
MKLVFRLYRRGRNFYAQNNETGQQQSLNTTDKGEATRLLNAMNEGSRMAGLNLQMARAYMAATDPQMPNRTWQEAVDFIIREKSGPSRARWVNVSKDKALAPLWKWKVVEILAGESIKHRRKELGLFVREAVAKSPVFVGEPFLQDAGDFLLSHHAFRKQTTFAQRIVGRKAHVPSL